MASDKNFYASDRIRVINDERERVIILRDFNLTPPPVGIFDEPTRCYRVNLQWAKIITGAIDLLLEIAVWPDADHEDYIGIRAIRDFLVGEICMNCDEVENCLQTSATIAAIQQAITALQNADINLQNQINTNANDIAQNTADIAFNLNEINTLTNTAIDHENRIAALEAAGGGSGSGGTPVEMAVWETFLDALTTTLGNTITIDNIPADALELRLKLISRKQQTGAAVINMFANDDLVSSNYRFVFSGGQQQTGARVGSLTGGGQPAPVRDLLEVRVYDLQQSHWRRALSYDSTVTARGGVSWIWLVNEQITKLQLIAGAGQFDIGTHVIVEVLRKRDVLIVAAAASSPVDINFSQDITDYQHYSAGDTENNGGISDLGGNPAGCYLVQGAKPTELTIFVDIDLLEQKSITDISFDFLNDYSSQDIIFRLYADTVQEELYDRGTVLPQTWETFNWQTSQPFTPFSAQILRVEIQLTGTEPSGEFRLDNIHVEFSEI